jgi:outer membrane protein OmpA-like peptidoglycan-associated protein
MLSKSARLAWLGLAASAAMLPATVALAQTVRMFDDAPSLEQLRAIMIPESAGSGKRAIVLQAAPRDALPSPIQKAASQVVGPPPAQVAPTPVAPAPVAQVPASAPAASEPAVGFRIRFDFNSAELPPSAYSMIDRIAELMRESSDLKLRVEGHTDAVGSADYNMSLSERRALSVVRYLTAHGVPAARLMPVGKGMEEPVVSNPYDAANRRVQFVRAL